ncbi:MAG: hypothetical protein GY799_15740 [Desulfobulbaceae bacterium]|nr:hypothetical protein [Desulfobulbaceae bacterium]
MGWLIMSPIDHINGLAPSGFLAVIDFTKIENLSLTDLAVWSTLILDYRPEPLLVGLLVTSISIFHRLPPCGSLVARLKHGTLCRNRCASLGASFVLKYDSGRSNPPVNCSTPIMAKYWLCRDDGC